MDGLEMVKQVKRQRKEGEFFIRWWRKENDFVDYELIDKFLEHVDTSKEFEGFELLDIETMWQTLHRVAPDHLQRDMKWGKEVICWERPEKQEDARHQVCPFTPESIMTIFDVETKGNTIE